MKIKLFVLSLLTVLGARVFAQELHWEVEDGLYDNSMTITSVICIDGVEQKTDQLEIGAFCGSEIRGSIRPQYVGSFDRYIAFLSVLGGTDSKEDDIISFRLYDHSIGEELDLVCSQTFVYVANDIHGGPTNPYVINFTTPIPAFTFTGEGSWDETSNWQGATLPTETDDVVIDGTALISNEVVIKSLVINAGKSLTIQNGGILTVIETIANTDYDALIIEDGGQIIQTNENVAATFKKNIVNPTSWSNPVSGWQFISSPMLDAATEGFESTEGDYDLYKFDGAAELQWVNYKKHNDFEDTFTPGVGYIASYESQTTASFQGILNNETEYFDFGIDYNSSNDWANFYLLGNPFSFDIDWEYMSYNIKKMEEGFVTLDANTGAYIYNVDGVIKVGEGFLICTNGKNPYLEYGEEEKKLRSNKSDYINIIASNSNGSDNVIINDVESESTGFPKLDNINPNIANVYVKHEDRRYGIFNRGESEEIELHFDAKEMGNYTLSFDIKGNYENLYLIDKMTGERVNLLLENEYTFTAMSNDNSERFIIKMDNSQQSTDNSHFAYISGEELFVNAEGTIQIIDLMGRVVMTEENHSGSINIGELNNAAYIVRCVNEKEVRTQKIVVL